MEEQKIMTELTLEPDLSADNAFIDSVPEMRSVAVSEEKKYSAGTIDDSMLSAEERALVERFANEIDIENVEQIVNYGIKAQSNISDFSTVILNKVKTYDLGEVGDSLKELTAALDATVEPEKKGIRGMFRKAKKGADSIKANYAKAESNVDRIEKDLVKHKEILSQDITMYQQMYDLNLRYYKELTMYIIAGRMALGRAQSGKLAELQKTAELTGKQEDIQKYRDMEDLCYRFEKKLSDLEITRVISIQTAPQVRMLQNNDREMMDKLQSSIANTIPLWRNQLVLSLGLEHTNRALAAQAALADKTNELLRKNSEMLKMATIETARQSERPIVDIETLKQCNKDLVSSISEVLNIHEQGRVQRAKAQEELVRIEEELKQTMLEAGRK